MIKTFLIATGTMFICLPVYVFTMVCKGIREGLTDINNS